MWIAVNPGRNGSRWGRAVRLSEGRRLEALGFGFGVGFVAAVLLDLLTKIGAWGGGPADVIMFMVPAYSLGLIFGSWRYR